MSCQKKKKEEILEDAAYCVLLLQFPGHTGVMQALRRSVEFPKLPFILGTLALKGRTPSTTWRGNQVQAGEPPSSCSHAHASAGDPSSLDMCKLEPLPLLHALGIS